MGPSIRPTVKQGPALKSARCFAVFPVGGGGGSYTGDVSTRSWLGFMVRVAVRTCQSECWDGGGIAPPWLSSSGQGEKRGEQREEGGRGRPEIYEDGDDVAEAAGPAPDPRLDLAIGAQAWRRGVELCWSSAEQGSCLHVVLWRILLRPEECASFLLRDRCAPSPLLPLTRFLSWHLRSICCCGSGFDRRVIPPRSV